MIDTRTMASTYGLRTRTRTGGDKAFLSFSKNTATIRLDLKGTKDVLQHIGSKVDVYATEDFKTIVIGRGDSRKVSMRGEHQCGVIAVRALTEALGVERKPAHYESRLDQDHNGRTVLVLTKEA